MKSQVIIEFSIMFSALAIISLIILQVINLKMEEIRTASEYKMLEVYGKNIQNEILMAYNSKPGYERTFFVPETINDKEYNLSLQNNYLILTQGYKTFFFILPDVNGAVKKGNNTIRNENGKIKIN